MTIPSSNPIIFKSAVDGWYYLLTFGVPLLCLGLLFAVIDAESPMIVFPILAVLLLTLALPAWLLLSTQYRVDHDTLNIRSGPFTWTIPLSDIHSVRPSRSLLSSPALSLNRLEIKYGNGNSILISPQDTTGFLVAIKQAQEPA